MEYFRSTFSDYSEYSGVRLEFLRYTPSTLDFRSTFGVLRVLWSTFGVPSECFEYSGVLSEYLRSALSTLEYFQSTKNSPEYSGVPSERRGQESGEVIIIKTPRARRRTRPNPGEVLPEKLGGGVRPASQKPYPIYDQNLRYSLPYL